MDRLDRPGIFHFGIKSLLLAGCIILLAISVYSTSLIVFLFFVAAYIQLPGMFLLALCGNKKNQISTETLLLGFFVGLGTLIIEYFLFSSFGLRAAFILFNPLALIALIIKKKVRNIVKICAYTRPMPDPQVVILFAAVLLITGITQKYSFYDLEQFDSIYLYQDMSWHIGNISSLSKGYPFTDIRFSGLHFYYHFFNDLIFGMCKYCFGINASTLWFKCTPLLSAGLFSLGISALFKKASQKSILGCTMFVLCGGAIPYYLLNSKDYYSLINYHIFSNINGVAVSLAAVAAVFLSYCDLYEEKSGKKRYLLLAILVFTLTGLKGPFAVVLVAAMMFTSALMLLYDHNYKRAFAVASATFGTFLLTYIIIIKGIENLFKASNNNRATVLSITDTFVRSRLWPMFGHLLDYGDKGHLLLYCLCVALFGSIIAAGVYFIFFFGETILTAFKLARKTDIPRADIILSITTGWIGLAGFWLVSHEGFSQAYFLFIAILFVVLEATRALENSKGLIKNAMVVLVIVNSLISGQMFFGSLLNVAKDDSAHYVYRNTAATNDEPQYLTHEEMEGLTWIRDNTEKDNIIATDRQDLWSLQEPTSDSDCRCFYYSAFTERQMYLEGFSYSDVSEDEVKEKLHINRALYSEDPEKAKRAAEKSGIDYIIVTNRFEKAPGYFKEPVFTNSDISIYKCNGQ